VHWFIRISFHGDCQKIEGLPAVIFIRRLCGGLAGLPAVFLAGWREFFGEEGIVPKYQFELHI